MNGTVKTIVGLLANGKPELQVAAAQILGELKPRELAAVRSIGEGIARSPVLARFCLDALGKIRTAPALRMLAEALLGTEALAEHAAHLLGEIGTAAHGVLAAQYPRANPEQQARILAVLSRHFDKEGLQVFVQALLIPETSTVAATLLEAEAKQFVPATAKLLREGIAKHLDESLPEACLAHVLEVLAKVDGAGARALFLRFMAAGAAPVVRAAAFRGLRGSKLTAAQVSSMMELLEDSAQKDVHEAVREVLAQLPELPAGIVPGLKRLLASRQVEQRLFALRMLRGVGGAELGKACIKLLDHDDERIRQAASAALATNKQAIEPLLKLLLATRNPELAQACQKTLTLQAPHMTPKVLRTMAEKAVKLLGGNTALGDSLLDLVMLSAGAKLAPFFLERAVRLRRSRHWAEALHLLAKLASTPHGGDEAHYQIALTKVVSAKRDHEEDAAPGNSTMGFFTVLVRAGFPLFDRLRRESCMTPDMLLRIATHFASSVGVDRRFGMDLLQHLAGRTKGRAGDEAKLALRSVGA